MAGTERWLPIADTDGLYSVSDLGRVRREPIGRVLKPFPTRGGPCVSLSVGGRARTAQVAGLVAAAWLGPPPWGVRRLVYQDGDRTNTRADNLRWVLARAPGFAGPGAGAELATLTDGQIISLILAATHEAARRGLLNLGH